MSVDPAQFARVVADTPDAELEQGMRSENRGLVLDEIFKRMEEHFDAERAAGVEAIVDWKILDRPEGGYDHYRVEIGGGACRVHRDPDGDGSPRVTFRVRPVDFLKLVTGNASGPQMFITGRLRIEGDLMLAARVQGFFEIPSLR
ncbi:MAG: SCP2 sterol-binding domain-containing protein [Actinomycetota bacterium]|nr:SCP2 sterol-binding domain-containing protein [Actinomycetota bacterium]